MRDCELGDVALPIEAIQHRVVETVPEGVRIADESQPCQIAIDWPNAPVQAFQQLMNLREEIRHLRIAEVEVYQFNLVDFAVCVEFADQCVSLRVGQA